MKKGISVLVATVLILGFTIAIAAAIMVWGQGFIGGLQERSETTANAQLICANDVVLSISHVCLKTQPNLFTLTLKNDGSKEIDKVMLRFYESPSVVKTSNASALAAFGINIEDITPEGIAGQVKLVEAIPVITVGSDQVTCTANIKKFGNLDNEKVWVKSC